MQFPQQPVLALCGESLSGIPPFILLYLRGTKPLHIALFHLIICQYMMKFRKIKKTIWLI